MKFIVLIGDGMADFPLEELGGKTPLMAASTPNMDWIAEHGRIGLVRTIPPGFPSGTEIANMSLLGYDPARYFTGRGPLEAASMRVSLEADDLAFRCNLVTLGTSGNRLIMEDFTAEHITSGEAGEIIRDIDGKMGTETIRFFPGVSYRHLMVWRDGGRRKGLADLALVPPHDIVGREISDYLPEEGGEDGVVELLTRSQDLLKDHPVNLARREKGLRPANSIWLWGQGRSPQLPQFRVKYGVDGGVISAVDLVKGIGVCIGFTPINVQGATGYLNTNYRGKAEAALRGLRDHDFIFLHVEAPDEAGHNANIGEKIEAIERFDEKVVGTVLEGLKDFEDYRIMVASDHLTPIPRRTHTDEPTPFAWASKGELESHTEGFPFSEAAARESGLFFGVGYELIDSFLFGD